MKEAGCSDFRNVGMTSINFGSNGPFPLPVYCALPITSHDLSECIISYFIYLFTKNILPTPGESPQMPMSPYKKESDMKALVSIRIADNVAEEEVLFYLLNTSHDTTLLLYHLLLSWDNKIEKLRINWTKNN